MQPQVHSFFVVGQLGVYVIQVRQDALDDDRNNFTVQTRFDIERNTKRLLDVGVVVVVIKDHMRIELSSGVVFNEELQIVDRIDGLFKDHQFVTHVFHGGDFIAKAGQEVKGHLFNGLEPVELTFLHERQVVHDQLLKLTSQLVQVHGRLEVLVVKRIDFVDKLRELGFVVEIYRVDTNCLFHFLKVVSQVVCSGQGTGFCQFCIIRSFNLRYFGHFKCCWLPLVEELRRVDKVFVPHGTNESYETIVDQVLAKCLCFHDIAIILRHIVQDPLSDGASTGNIVVNTQNWNFVGG